MTSDSIEINRAPVLALWMAVVANRLGNDWDVSSTIGKVYSGLNAQAKGKAIGIFTIPEGPHKRRGLGEEFWIQICGKGIPMKTTEHGPRAVTKDKPIDPTSVEKYFAKAFGEDLSAVRKAMEQLANVYPPEELAAAGFELYAKFRPRIEFGQTGWGQKGKLDLGVIKALANKRS